MENLGIIYTFTSNRKGVSEIKEHLIQKIQLGGKRLSPLPEVSIYKYTFNEAPYHVNIPEDCAYGFENHLFSGIGDCWNGATFGSLDRKILEELQEKEAQRIKKEYARMKVDIEEIVSKKLFSGLLLGKPRDGLFEKELDDLIKLSSRNDYPIINVSAQSWKDLGLQGKFRVGTWGHLTSVKATIKEGDDNYNFNIIFNFYPEVEKFEDVLHQKISETDWKSKAYHWDIGDW